MATSRSGPKERASLPEKSFLRNQSAQDKTALESQGLNAWKGLKQEAPSRVDFRGKRGWSNEKQTPKEGSDWAGTIFSWRKQAARVYISVAWGGSRGLGLTCFILKWNQVLEKILHLDSTVLLGYI